MSGESSVNGVVLVNERTIPFMRRVIVPQKPIYSLGEVSEDFLDRARARDHPLELISFIEGGMDEAEKLLREEKQDRENIDPIFLRRFCYDGQTPLILYSIPRIKFPGVIGLYGCGISKENLPLDKQFLFHWRNGHS